MKTTLRTTVAALALAAPLGAALAQNGPVFTVQFATPAVVAQSPAPRIDRHVRRDTTPPRIYDLTPSHGDRVRERGWTEISARLDDDRSGIDRRSVVLRVDGRNVSHRVRFDGDEVRFRDDLNAGRHVAELVVRDQAGNTTRRTWSFDVIDRGRPYGYGYGR